ncbi:MAG: hypothetical protein H0U76_03755, partial [Ktedonobacteraceae bacterium]|nr:hypothetical protein [Ktedonobacteraceae bacterium]
MESGLCFAFLVVRAYRRVHVLQGIERQRVACTRETSVRMASIEFASQGEIAPLPSAISVIPVKAVVWRDVLYLSLFFLLLWILPFIALLVVAGFFVSLIITLILVAFFSFLFPYAALSFLKTEVTVEARERGLHVEKRERRVLKEQIVWDEAHLFACYTLPNLLPWEKTQYYELSSSTHVVTWISVPDKRSPFTMWKPVLSAQEYHRQMQALCDVITAKTGLALCDLT